MKLFQKEKRKRTCYATYEKACPCCGRKFRATYRANDMYAYRVAKDMVNLNYNTHKFICIDTSVKMNYSE